jgi:DNA polymerase-3 subunit alpha
LLLPFSYQAQKSNSFSNSNQTGRLVTLTYQNAMASGDLELGTDWRVNLHDDLLQSLTAHFGIENIEIVF